MNSWIFLFLFALTTSFVNCLEFSQFYLPQCCYIPPPGNHHPQQQQQPQQFSIHQSPSYRHDIKARKADPTHIVSLNNFNNKEEENSTTVNTPPTPHSATTTTTRNKKSKTAAARLYRYIIPLKKSQLMTNSNEAREANPTGDTPEIETIPKLSTSPVVVMRENGIKMQKNLQNDMKEEEMLLDTEKLLSSAQIETELKPTMSTKIKHMLLSNKNSTYTLPSIESILFAQNMTLESMLKMNSKDSMQSLKFKRNADATEQDSGEINQATTRNNDDDAVDADDDDRPSKMPPSWVTNLRRALYQSMESLLLATKSKSDNTKSSSQEETIQAKSSNNGNPYQQSSHEDQGNSVLWHKLRDANFSLVEPMTRYSTAIPKTLYLPPGQGPIASGVVVNTVNGMQLRMASELNFQQDDPMKLSGSAVSDCSCHLIHNGEILMAYWSVSRILNEKGQPALQYLIYPLPYNTPTPPVMLPFTGDKNIALSSPYDPLPNLHADYGKVLQTIGHGHQHRHGAGRKIVQGGQNHRHHHNGYENYQELPLDLPIQNPQNQVAFPPNYEQVFKHMQQFNQLPPPHTPGIHDQTGAPSPGDYRGVVIENENGYTPEFINIYKQAVENHIQHKDHYEQGPFSNNNNQNFPQHIPSPPLTHPSASPHIYGNVDKTFAPPPSHIQLFDGKAPTFPKSIQDILSPFPPQISLPHNIPGLSQHPNFENDAKIYQQHSQGHGGVVNPQQLHDPNLENPQLHHHQELPPGTPDGGLVGPPQKGYDINNYYSFADGVKGHHYLHPQPGRGGSANPENGGYLNPYHNPNQHRVPQHTTYPDHRRRPSSTFVGSNDEEIRHYHRRQQQLPTRHRSEKYSRQNQKRFNQDGSYILNF